MVDFDDWVAARGPALMRLAYYLTGSRTDAEDAVQDALSRALPRWKRISTMNDPDAYVRRMVYNAHISRWRKTRNLEVLVDAFEERPLIDGVAAEDRDRMWRACLALPAAQRTAVVLRFYEDLDYSEIAALTGAREGSVRVNVSRGVAALRAQFGGTHD